MSELCSSNLLLEMVDGHLYMHFLPSADEASLLLNAESSMSYLLSPHEIPEFAVPPGEMNKGQRDKNASPHGRFILLAGHTFAD